jgi:hypothetical protein
MKMQKLILESNPVILKPHGTSKFFEVKRGSSPTMGI